MGDGDHDNDDDLEFDLDLDPIEHATQPGGAPKRRSRQATETGVSRPPPPLDAPTVRPPETDFGQFAPPGRRSMIPGPGMVDDATSSRPTDPGFSRRRADSTQKIRRAELERPKAAHEPLSEEACRARLGSLQQAPRVKVAPEDIFALGLDHRAGFLYSQIDGFTSIEDLISISPMAEVETLRIFVQLLEHDAIELG